MDGSIRLRVLIADDDEDVQKAIKRSAARAGYEVLQVYDGLAVLDRAKEEQPDVILLDVTMPGADGRDVLRQLKLDPATERIPVLICSGRTDQTDRIVGLGLGAEDYVNKPFAADELMRKIAKLIEKSSQLSKISDASLVRAQFDQAIESATAGRIEDAQAALRAGQRRLERIRQSLTKSQTAELDEHAQRASQALREAPG
jgi:two-component system, OmpR family, KDP operon response regulator KdpE